MVMQEHPLGNVDGIPTDADGIPTDQDQVLDLSPWGEHLADNLFLNKLLLWNQPHLTGRQGHPPDGSTILWQWPSAAHDDPEG